MIKDSGERQEFSTGAVRDVQDGKGRPTLMPLREVATLLDTRLGGEPVIRRIAEFTETGNIFHLYHALGEFAKIAYSYQFETMLLEVAIHYADGCEKYGVDNWKKGIPVSRYLDSTIRHYLKYRRGDDDEPHDRAVCWNLLSACWTCNHKPELNDYATNREEQTTNEH